MDLHIDIQTTMLIIKAMSPGLLKRSLTRESKGNTVYLNQGK